MSAAMFDPRPEIRMATRLRSRMVGGGPILGRAPCASAPADGAAARALFDAPDLEDGFAGAFECCADRVGFASGDDHGHADAAVEGPRHFLGRDAPAALQ